MRKSKQKRKLLYLKECWVINLQNTVINTIISTGQRLSSLISLRKTFKRPLLLGLKLNVIQCTLFQDFKWKTRKVDFYFFKSGQQPIFQMILFFYSKNVTLSHFERMINEQSLEKELEIRFSARKKIFIAKLGSNVIGIVFSTQKTTSKHWLTVNMLF